MTLEQCIERLGKVADEMKSHYYGRIMANMGSDARQMIYDRVTKEGENAKGSKYRAYSTRAMLVSCKSFKKEKCETFFGSKEKRKNLQWRTVGSNKVHLAILPGGYKQLRTIHGLQTSHVDFMWSGKMWANIKVKSTDSNHKNGIAIIGATEDIQKKKLEGNTARRGDILDLSQTEQESLKRMYLLDTLEVFKINGIQ